MHGSRHVAQAIACGATVMQVTSALLAHGPAHVGVLRQGPDAWLTEKGYGSVAKLRGILNAAHAPDPAAWSRLNYIHTLDGCRSILERGSQP